MELLLGFLLIILTGYYAGTETALYRANWVRLLHWSKRKLAGAADALAALERLTPSIITALIGTNLTSVFATQLFEHYFVRELGAVYTPLAIAIVLLLTLLLGDYLPKALAQSIPTRWLRAGAFLLNFTRLLFYPVVMLLTRILPRTRRLSLTREDYLKVLPTRTSAGARLKSMTTRLFRFTRLPVTDAAIPCERIISVPSTADRQTLLELLRQFGYTRIPVYEHQPENIVGVILTKDLLNPDPLPIRPVLRVSPETRVLEVLRMMQRQGEHLAVIQNPAGSAFGIVTLEDLVEELVGEIRSED
jgi:CBS domain containing-hemolysin-like protein